MDRDQLARLRDVHRAGLEDAVAFWERHAVDREYGGFFTFLDRHGQLYGTDKPVWLQGRAAWLFATLYDRVERREEWLALARHGCEFLAQHCFDERGKMYFLVTREGRPLRMRRYAYSEVFGILAFAALAKATGDEVPRNEARALFDQFVRYQTPPSLLEPKVDPDTRPMKALAPLMCLLCAADTMLTIDPNERYERIIDAAVDEIFRDFVKPDRRAVLETVGPGGELVEGFEGRVMNPGHTIEAAWFMFEIARRRQDQALLGRAVHLLDFAFERGWDSEFGGLFYFVDVDGRPATQLEHDLKLWWPHCEALYASLLAYHLTGSERYATFYERVHDYTFAHFPDREHGEWFGYLHRDGTLSTPLKGGLWKGPFHVHRALLYCWKLLETMAA